MSSLLEQIKQRRSALGLTQADMLLRAGMSRQQYQRLEARGNPRLDTLELIAQGLGSELLLIPREKLAAVRAMLEAQSVPGAAIPATPDWQANPLADDPWQGLLDDTAE